MFHRITEQLRLGGTSRGHLVTYSSLPKTMFRQHLSSSKDGDTTASQGNLLQSVLGHRHNKNVQREAPVLQFVLVASCPVTGHH